MSTLWPKLDLSQTPFTFNGEPSCLLDHAETCTLFDCLRYNSLHISISNVYISHFSTVHVTLVLAFAQTHANPHLFRQRAFNDPISTAAPSSPIDDTHTASDRFSRAKILSPSVAPLCAPSGHAH
jgi:hypothetical protein